MARDGKCAHYWELMSANGEWAEWHCAWCYEVVRVGPDRWEALEATSALLERMVDVICEECANQNEYEGGPFPEGMTVDWPTEEEDPLDYGPTFPNDRWSAVLDKHHKEEHRALVDGFRAWATKQAHE